PAGRARRDSSSRGARKGKAAEPSGPRRSTSEAHAIRERDVAARQGSDVLQEGDVVSRLFIGQVGSPQNQVVDHAAEKEAISDGRFWQRVCAGLRFEFGNPVLLPRVAEPDEPPEGVALVTNRRAEPEGGNPRKGLIVVAERSPNVVGGQLERYVVRVGMQQSNVRMELAAHELRVALRESDTLKGVL